MRRVNPGDPAGSRLVLFEINFKTVKLAPDVDLQGVAARTEGYSGADITSVCRDAAMMAMRRVVKGKTPDQIRNMNKEEMNQPTNMADIDEALGRTSRSVGKEDIEKYEKWMEEFGAT